MLVHICCSVDSHYFLQQLQNDFLNENLVGFFYDPNIHPYSEYLLRLQDVKYSCKKLGIKLYEGEYDFQNWLKAVKGLENEPEKGDRCLVCFDKRLEQTAKKTLKLKHKTFTTTLLMSPLKSQERLENIGKKLEKLYDLKFIFKDYRKNNGAHLQSQIVKQNNLYRQNYCGCMFALNMQRQNQNKLCSELISCISKQILPQSIESRLNFYKQREKFDNKNINYKIIDERFLNYRNLNSKIIVSNKTIPSYFICYSTTNSKKTNGKIQFEKNNINYLNKDSIKLITIKTFNTFANTNFKNTMELFANTLEFDDELNCRHKILKNPYDLSCLIVVDTIPKEKITIFCDTKVYEDTRQKIYFQ